MPTPPAGGSITECLIMKSEPWWTLTSFRVSDQDTVVGVRLQVGFSKDRDSTANAFWSLTMYDE
jgi:hypothetical protein